LAMRKGMTMTNETRKQIMYADHDREWAPQEHHVGPWRVKADAGPGPRLLLAWKHEIKDGVPTTTMRMDCGRMKG